MFDSFNVQYLLGTIVFWQGFYFFGLYFTDRKLKLYSILSIRQVSMLKLTKFRYFFVYYKRREGVITKRAFVCMIAYYIVNTIGGMAVFAPSIIALDLSLTNILICYLVSHIGLFMAAIGIRELEYEQKKIYNSFIEDQRKRKTEEKKNKLIDFINYIRGK